MRLMETLGPLVRTTRERKGIRAADLAFQIGKDPSYLSRLERDLLKEMPTPEVLASLSRVLGISEVRMLKALGFLAGESSDAPEVPLFAEDDPRADIVRLLADINDRNAKNVLSLVRSMWDDRDQMLNAPVPPEERARRVS